MDFAVGHGLLPSMEPFVDIVTATAERLRERFGFQRSSVENQLENVILLLSNIYSHVDRRSESSRIPDS
eukprot:SAG31_NODE_5575_length_2448_cov_1.476799_1_plen_68_part_10